MTAKKLREERAKRGFTQEKLSLVCGVSYSSVVKWENGIKNMSKRFDKIVKEELSRYDYRVKGTMLTLNNLVDKDEKDNTKDQ